MIDQVLDFAIDHAVAFAALLVVTVVTASSALAWGFDLYHERQTRRRAAR